ncbi:hypothetical protein B2J88_44605 [Rhodococcus sp. SRB_17]|nr:hypothetical protein [Rhodococcus sp. SRB_17]
MVRFCRHRFDFAEVAAADEFCGDSEGGEDAAGAFDGGDAHSCTGGDGFAGGGDSASGFSFGEAGVDDGDGESGFGADGVGFAELAAGGGVEECADLVLPLGAAGPDRGPGVFACLDGPAALSVSPRGSFTCLVVETFAEPDDFQSSGSFRAPEQRRTK